MWQETETEGIESVFLVVLAAVTIAVTAMSITGRLSAWSSNSNSSTKTGSAIPLAEACVVQNDGKHGLENR